MSRSQRTEGVESARKALQILLSFTEERPRASVEDLARTHGIPRSTAYRHVGLLRELGLIDEGERGRYHVTSRIHAIARAADAAGELILVARPVLEQVMRATGETAGLMRLLGDAAITVDQVVSQQPLRLSFALGRTMTLIEGAPSKVLLASLPASTRSAYLDRMAAADPLVARDRAAREAELAAIRRRGHAESFEEVDTGYWACAAPIHEHGRVVAAVGVACALTRLDERHRNAIVARTVAAGREISDRLARAAAVRPGSARSGAARGDRATGEGPADASPADGFGEQPES